MINKVIIQNMSERELQDNVIALAKALGYLVHAERPAMKKDGQWVTPVQGDKGFPDLVLVNMNKHHILFIELKSHKGKMSADQLYWQKAMYYTIIPTSSFMVSYYVWRPSDWFNGTIEGVLK